MDQIEEVRQKTDIVKLISEHIPLKKAGRNFKALCPFHSEDTASFSVSPERQIWKCFGCGKAGSVYNFLMEYEGMEFGEALRFLANRAGVKLQAYKPSAHQQEKEELFALNHLSTEFYHYLLTKHKIGKPARDYLRKRAISQYSIKKFNLGFAPDLWDGLIKFLVGKKKKDPKVLEKAGLIIKSDRVRHDGSSYYDRFRNRIIFPLSDHRGNIIGFSGRTLDPAAKGAKYINSPETLIYHKSDVFYGLNITREDVKKQNETILVEGEFDLISSYQAGVKNVVAIKGSALTENQVNLIKRFCDRISFALDTDLAGDAAAIRGIAVADKAGLDIGVIVIPEGKDPDDFSRADPKGWQQLVKKPTPVFDFYIQSAFRRFGGKTSEEKRKISRELIPLLGAIDDPVMHADYLKKLASRLGVEEVTINQAAVKYLGQETKAPPVVSGQPKPTAITKKTAVKIQEEYLVALLLQADRFKDFAKRDFLALFSDQLIQKIIKNIQKLAGKHKKLTSDIICKDLPAELRERFDLFFLIDLGNIIDNTSKLDREIEKIKEALSNQAIRAKIGKLKLEIKSIEGKGKLSSKDYKNLSKLNSQFAALSKELK